MNEQDHTRYEDDLAAYLLDALPGDEKHRFERPPRQAVSAVRSGPAG